MSVNRDKLADKIVSLGNIGLCDFYNYLSEATTGDKKTAWNELIMEVPLTSLGVKVCIDILEYGGIEKMKEAYEKDSAFENIILDWQKFVRAMNR